MRNIVIYICLTFANCFNSFSVGFDSEPKNVQMRVQADPQGNHKKMLVKGYFEHISHCSLTAHYNELDNESYTSIIIQEMY